MPTAKESISSRAASCCRAFFRPLSSLFAGLIAAALLACPAAASGRSGAQAVSASRQSFLTELRLRRIVPVDSAIWTPDQYTLMLRVREAEVLGAFRLLRSKLGTLRGFAVEHRSPAGYRELWLTKSGYRKFIFLLSQDARSYFESKGGQAKFIFRTRSMKGKRLFSNGGILTQEGIAVYMRIQRKLAVFWKYPDGRVTGTVRPSKAAASPPAAAGPGRRPRLGGKMPPPKPSPEADAAARSRAAALIRSGYVEITAAEEKYLLRSTKLGEAHLQRESSLQIIATRDKAYYLISPSDPLMALVARHRTAGSGASPAGSKTLPENQVNGQ